MHIHILQAVKSRSLRASKDTNGGYGTVNDFGTGLVATLLKYFKSRTMNYPEILPAYTMAILKQQGHTVTFGVNQVDPQAEIVLLQTSIVNFQNELDWANQIKRASPKTRVGFMGGMATGNPQLYQNKADFVIAGEAEAALLGQPVEEMVGLISPGQVQDLDNLPFPDWSYLQNQNRRYGLLQTGGRFLPMQASRGCPMSCGYYCTYPLTQGANHRSRSPENVVAEIAYLQDRYNMQTVMFRDPIFSLKMKRVEQICELILAKGIKFSWICETHPRFLNPELAALMAQAGCKVVKLGIESGNPEVMKKSQRAAADLAYQEEIVRCLEKHHIKVMAFYILGYMDDQDQTVRQTIDYAVRLNTYGAQFTVATPYPGTAWFNELSSKPEVQLDANLEHYNQYRLVFNHPHLNFQQLEQLKSLAYRRYYFRLSYATKHLLRIG